MSLQQANKWLDTHSLTIPALAAHKQAIDELLEQEQLSHELVPLAAHDTGLLLNILSAVNERRGAGSGRDIVESPQAAIALLGEKVSHEIFKNAPVAEKQLTNPEQLFAFLQIINRSYHNEIQATSWAIENGHKQIDQIKVMALLAYSGELLCCLYDFDTYLQYLVSGANSQAALQAFGFQFPHLTEALCQRLNLPDLLTRSLPHSNDPGVRAQLLRFTARLCDVCESGWYNDSMLAVFTEFAEFLDQPVDQVMARTHQFSITSARQSPIENAWQPAARLILISDQHRQPLSRQQQQIESKTDATASVHSDDNPKTSTPDVFERIKKMVKQADVSQSDILNACLKGLFEDIELSKVSLMLLSKDKQTLQNRMVIGIDQQSPFRRYKIALQQSGLLKLLMQKPQAIWINPNNIKKYQQLIPQSLQASIMTHDFLAMSLFIGNQPIGLVYADRSNTPQTLDPATFTRFKQLISLTSKALTLLSKR